MQAFGQRIGQVHGELRGMAQARLGGMETPSLAAGDLLQETLLKLAASPPAWQGQLGWRGMAHPSQLPLGLDLLAALQAHGQQAAAQGQLPQLAACAQGHAAGSPWRQRLARLAPPAEPG